MVDCFEDCEEYFFSFRGLVYFVADGCYDHEEDHCYHGHGEDGEVDD